jgi:DNA primase
MQHSAKYLIHADIRASGVVERGDVVGAIFGQTEGLLGDGLDLRNLQDSSKIGHIDVEVETESGRSFGTVTIASNLDRVETAVLAASLETIEKVGPCRAECTVADIEDARAAKRREVVDRATELLTEFEESTITGERLIETVRERARTAELTTYEDLPAGPRVADSDAIIVAEGRADVRRLLEVGIRNAVAVEGTDVPEAVAELTHERTTTAFLDGDRGGDLILRELQQVGDVDYVAFAPADESVEDLDRAAITAALRKKLPAEQVAEGATPREAFAPTDGGTIEPQTGETVTTGPEADAGVTPDGADAATTDGTDAAATESAPESDDSEGDEAATDDEAHGVDETATSDEVNRSPETLAGHVEAVIGGETDRVRLLDESFETLGEDDADDAVETLAESEAAPHSVVIDGTVTQRILDVAAQRGVGQVVGTAAGEFVKQPASVRVRTADEFELAC